MKKTLRQRIYEYLKRNPTWIQKGHLADLSRQAHYSSENCGRRLRELQNDNLIEVKYEKGKDSQELCWYRYKEPVKKYIPLMTKEGTVRLLSNKTIYE